jgi:hypothetical protein
MGVSGGYALDIQFMDLKDYPVKSVDHNLRQALIESGLMDTIMGIIGRSRHSESEFLRFTGGEDDPWIRNRCTGNSKLAYLYAYHVIHGRFPEGERAISKDAGVAFRYAKNFIRGRFPEAEPTIVDAGLAPQYTAFLRNDDVVGWGDFRRDYPEIKVER